MEHPDNPLLDVALAAIRERAKNTNPIQVEHIAIALEAVGLPALLERVEAAEAEVARLREELLHRSRVLAAERATCHCREATERWRSGAPVVLGKQRPRPPLGDTP